MLNDLPWLHSPATIAALVMIPVGALLMLWGIIALYKVRLTAFALGTLAGFGLVFSGMMVGLVAIGTYGYKALTSEAVVATIEVRPLGPQRFDARVVFREGGSNVFVMSGDELYVDARVLKWQPVATMLGLRTVYELDRIAGRYRTIQDERNNPRTVYPLAAPKPFDLFALRKRLSSLSPLVDAEFGSAAFVPADRDSVFELAVTASGLIIRAKPSP